MKSIGAYKYWANKELLKKEKALSLPQSSRSHWVLNNKTEDMILEECKGVVVQGLHHRLFLCVAMCGVVHNQPLPKLLICLSHTSPPEHL